MIKDLRNFIKILEKEGELIRVKEEVSTYLEMTEIQRRLLNKKGPAVLFENVINEKGKKIEMPVLVNLFGTVKRIAMGMNKKENELRAFGEELSEMQQPTPPKGLKDASKLWEIAKKAMSMRVKNVSNAHCQEVVLKGDDIDLDTLPIQTCWPKDIAPLITWGCVVTKGPDPSKDRVDNYNLGIYRLQKFSKNTLIMRWLKHRGGAQHFYKWKAEKKKPLPAAIVIGCDPATILAGVTPVPDNVSEYDYSGLLRGASLKLVKCKTIDLSVPANAEIVIEGFVDLNHYEKEGPFGDHTGYYNSVEMFPVFKITAITMRKKPIYLSTFTGRAPDEPSVLGIAMNEMFIPFFQKQFPEVVDFYLPPEGCSYRIAVVSIKKVYAGQAKRIMLGVWSYLRQFMYTKWVIIVDENINVRDWSEVWWAISTKMDPKRDITMLENTPIDYLDFASPLEGLGSKIGIDATNKISAESNREWGEEMFMDSDVIDKVSKKWKDMKLD